MKIVYLSVIFLSLYTHIHAMDTEYERAKIREYNDARIKCERARANLNLYSLKRISQNHNNHMIAAPDPGYVTALTNLSIAKHDLELCEKWMHDNGIKHQ